MILRNCTCDDYWNDSRACRICCTLVTCFSLQKVDVVSNVQIFRARERKRYQVIPNTWFSLRMEVTLWGVSRRNWKTRFSSSLLVAPCRRLVDFCLESGQLQKKERSTSRRLFQRFQSRNTVARQRGTNYWPAPAQ